MGHQASQRTLIIGRALVKSQCEEIKDVACNCKLHKKIKVRVSLWAHAKREEENFVSTNYLECLA